MIPIEQLVDALNGTFSVDKEMRTACEERLAHLTEKSLEIFGVLLNIISMESFPESTRQAASVYLKNLVFRIQLSSETDEELRASLRGLEETFLQVVISCSNSCCRPLLEVLRTLFEFFTPSGWSKTVPQTLNWLSSPNLSILTRALTILRTVGKTYEYAPGNNAIWETYPQMVLPELQSLFMKLISPKNSAGELNGSELQSRCTPLRVCCKILWSSTCSGMPYERSDSDHILRWLEILSTSMTDILKLIPHMETPEDAWGILKWETRIIHRWFGFCSRRKLGKKPAKTARQRAEKDFLNAWYSKYAERFALCCFNLCHVDHAADFKKSFALSTEYLSLVVNDAKLMSSLASYWKELILGPLFKALCFTENDEHLWVYEPEEYINRIGDLEHTIYDSREASARLIKNIIMKQIKDGNQSSVIQFLGFLGSHAQNEPPYTSYGAVHALDKLSPVLSKGPCSKAVTNLVKEVVLPGCFSQVSYIRSICFPLACRHLMALGGNEEGTKNFLKTGMQLLDSAEPLPVQVLATVGWRRILRRTELHGMVAPFLPLLVETSLRLSRELNNEDALILLEAVVDQFGDQLAAFAEYVTEVLVTHGLRMLEEERRAVQDVENQSSHQENVETASELCGALDRILNALYTLCASVTAHEEVYNALQGKMFPLFDKLLAENMPDYLEETLDLLSVLTMHSKSLLPFMWELLPRLRQILCDGGTDYLPSMLAPLDNYLCSSPQEFCQRGLVNFIVEICEHTLDRTQDYEDEIVLVAPSLLETLLQHGANQKEHIDHVLPLLLNLVLANLRHKKDSSTRLHLKLMHVILNAFWFDSHLCLNTLSSSNMFNEFFDAYGSFLEKYHKRLRNYDRKVSILGLSKVLPHVNPDIRGRCRTIIEIFLALNFESYGKETDKSNSECPPHDTCESDSDGYEKDLIQDSDFDSDDSDIALETNSSDADSVFSDEDYVSVIDDVCEAQTYLSALEGLRVIPNENLRKMCEFGFGRLQSLKNTQLSARREAQYKRMMFEKHGNL